MSEAQSKESGFGYFSLVPGLNRLWCPLEGLLVGILKLMAQKKPKAYGALKHDHTRLNKTLIISCLNRASIWPVSIINNSRTHSSVFIKNTLKIHVKFTPTYFGSQMEPSSGGQQLILAKVYKWFNEGSPNSQYCGGICHHNTDYLD